MAAKSEIELTTSFADGTNRKITVGPLSPEVATPSAIRGKIKNFNDNIADIAENYLSDSGASCTGITAASITTTEETKFDLKS